MSKGNQHKSKRSLGLKEIAKAIRGVDLFCGAGGLTRGLEVAGIDMRLGADIDPICEYPYTANNKASFLLKSVEDITSADLSGAFGDAPFRLLAGCAPCQPFSTYSQAWSSPSDERWNLLGQFSRLVEETCPHFVTMENVPLLRKKKVFDDFVAVLDAKGFDVFCDVVNCADYGVPQERQRLVVMASTLGPIKLIPKTTPANQRVTVKKAISDMRRLKAGKGCKLDPLHQASDLSPLNLRRIRASKPGGTWRDWDEDLRATCHRRLSGNTYSSVYGRMTWNNPSPTITTQYYGFGNGRFGHPVQDRAISLREGAILQSFPKDYKFVREGESFCRKSVGRLIGNAIPVKLGTSIGESFVLHVEDFLNSQGQAA